MVTVADALGATYEARKAGRRQIVPGYTGYIPHSREIAGRSQTRTAARASVKTPDELALCDGLPADPVNKDAITRLHHDFASTAHGKDMTATLVGRNEAVPKHVPGYTGEWRGCPGVVNFWNTSTILRDPTRRVAVVPHSQLTSSL